MALTGLQIYKLLPKTNCKECGCPTCLAFAMKLARSRLSSRECPYVSEEAKAALAAAAAPPIRLVTIGAGDRAVRSATRRCCSATRRPSSTSPAWSCACKMRRRRELDEVAGRVAGLQRANVSACSCARRHRRGARIGDAGAFARLWPRPAAAEPGSPARADERRRRRRSGAALAGGAAAERPLVYAADRRELAGDGRGRQEAQGCPLAVAPRRGNALGARRALRARQAAPASTTSCSTRAREPAGDARQRSRSSAAWRSRRASGRSATPSSPSPAATWQDELARRPPRHRQVRRGRDRSTTIRPGDGLRAAHAAAEHLHRPAEADPGRAQGLRDRRPEPDIARCWSRPTSRSPTSSSPARSRTPACPPGCWSPDSEGQSVLTAWAAGKFDAEKIAKSVKESRHRREDQPQEARHPRLRRRDSPASWRRSCPAGRSWSGHADAVDIPNYLKNVWSA